MSVAQQKLATTYPEFFPLDDMYYTLELDFEDWELERNKKKENKARKEQEARRNAAAQEEEEKKRKKGSTTSSRELRSLLPDVIKRKRGNPVYIYEGQEELYEALESVLTKIKDYSEHSYPFLTKVLARDAPDYYNVIKKPMDLGLMTKKLKRGEYSSKSEFQADLNLIYANCRIYNTDPSSKIYLEHAECLERRSKELMKTVKNIDFSKERIANPSTSPSVATPNQDDDEPHTTPKTNLQNSNDSTTNTSNTPPIKSKQKSPDKEKDKEKFNSSPISPIKIEIPDVENENFQSKTDLYRCLTRQYRLQKLTHVHDQGKLPFGERAALVRDPNNMRKFMSLSGYPGIPKKATTTSGQQPTSEQSTNSDQTTNNNNQHTTNSNETSKPSTPTPHDPPTPPITTTTEQEKDKDKEKDKEKEKEKEKDKDKENDKDKEKDKEKEKGEEDEKETAEDVIARDVGFFPELCFFTDSVPELHPCISSDNEEEEEQGREGRREAEDRREVAEQPQVEELNVVIKKEKEEVQQDEEERPRASKPPTPPTASTSAPGSPMQITQTTQEDATMTPAPAHALDAAPAHPPAFAVPRASHAPLHCVEYHNAVLRRTIALVLSRSGFVTIGSTQVMDVLTDVVNGYMLRLGRILKTHMDDIGGQVTMEEIFSRVLCEMGLAGLADLREFVQNLVNPPDADMDDLEYDPRNSLYNRSAGGGEFGDYGDDEYHDEYGNENEFSEEELGSGSLPTESSTGRQKRQVTKISERDNMYEYYEEEAPNGDSLASGSAPVYNSQTANSSKIAKPKKILQKKNVKPPPTQKKRSKNPPPNVGGVNKKKKQ